LRAPIPASIALQWIDITGLKSGRYRLTATADPAGWFLETSEANNATWLDLKLTGAGVSALTRGPAA
jgi:Lysyl oxidase